VGCSSSLDDGASSGNRAPGGITDPRGGQIGSLIPDCGVAPLSKKEQVSVAAGDGAFVVHTDPCTGGQVPQFQLLDEMGTTLTYQTESLGNGVLLIRSDMALVPGQYTVTELDGRASQAAAGAAGSMATIDPSGLLTAKTNGTVEVTATAQDASSASGSAEIEIANQPVLVEEITVEGTGGQSTIDEPGGTLQMVATIAPANATDQSVAWSVDDTNLATITSGGLLAAKANGDVRVTATAVDGSGTSGSTTIEITNQNSMSVSEGTIRDWRLTGFDDQSIVTHGAIEVRWDGPWHTDARVQLLSVTGKIVYAETIERRRSPHSIPTDRIPSGLYIMRVICHGELSNSRRVLVLGR